MRTALGVDAAAWNACTRAEQEQGLGYGLGLLEVWGLVGWGFAKGLGYSNSGPPFKQLTSVRARVDLLTPPPVPAIRLSATIAPTLTRPFTRTRAPLWAH